METAGIINVHTHAFTKKNVPIKFLPFLLRPVEGWLENKIFANVLSWVSENIFKKKTWASIIDKYHSFVKIGSEKNQLDVLKDLITQYPAGTKFCVLPMDMEYMGSGEVPQPYEEQLKELAAIKRDPMFKDIIYPFIFVHPERPNIFELVKHFIEVEDFSGIKLYPPIGYYPFDERLNKVYEYALEKRIPITTHCSRGGIFYRGKITDEMLVHPITGAKFERTDNKTFCQNYTEPDNYKYLLARFPNLVLNLAHFGGGSEWLKYLSKENNQQESTWLEKVIVLVKRYSNVYTDISYTMSNPDLFGQLKLLLQDNQLRNKILFGSDFYMVEQEVQEKTFFLQIISSFDEKDFMQIGVTNPTGFLGFTANKM